MQNSFYVGSFCKMAISREDYKLPYLGTLAAYDATELLMYSLRLGLYAASGGLCCPDDWQIRLLRRENCMYLLSLYEYIQIMRRGWPRDVKGKPKHSLQMNTLVYLCP